MSEILSEKDIRHIREIEAECQYESGHHIKTGHSAMITWSGLLSVFDSHEALRAENERLRELLSEGAVLFGGEMKYSLDHWWDRIRAELETPDEQAVQAGEGVVDQRVGQGPTAD